MTSEQTRAEEQKIDEEQKTDKFVIKSESYRQVQLIAKRIAEAEKEKTLLGFFDSLVRSRHTR